MDGWADGRRRMRRGMGKLMMILLLKVRNQRNVDVAADARPTVSPTPDTEAPRRRQPARSPSPPYLPPTSSFKLPPQHETRRETKTKQPTKEDMGGGKVGAGVGAGEYSI